jgi:CheY-like chemotaxis protein
MDALLLKQVLKNVSQNENVVSFECPLHALAHIEDCMERKAYVELPDLIFLDINMPHLNGFQFLDALSELEGNFKTKVVMVTSSDDVKDIEKSAEYEYVIGYLIKPVRKEDLMHLELLIASVKK